MGARNVPGGPAAVLPQAGELEELFTALSEATEALRQSHDELLKRVSELEQELARKNRALERKARLEALGKLAAGVAHEIRNPLGSLSLYIDLLEGEAPQTEAVRNLLDRMRQAVTHLSTTVNDVLTFTEPGPARVVSYDPREVLQEALLLCTENLNGAIRVTRRYPGEKRTAQGDPEYLRRIFINLITNACEAMSSGGRLEVTLRYEERQIVVAIKDTGPGIPAGDLEKVFLPFWTTREGGTGMGLAIVHSLVERHSGQIELRNVPEGGLEAVLRLPWSVPAEKA